MAQRREIILLFLCLLIGFALRFYTLDQKSLWIDEIHTFNDSRDGLAGQIRYYKENPTYLHPPLFFVLTHLFYPFEQPEKELRILPMIFGVLSIPMLYLLARSFSPSIAIPSVLSLTVMVYHVNLSQNGRPYSLIMFLGMVGLYFFVRHLESQKKSYLLFGAFFYAISFYASYSSILFFVLSQILWFYRPKENNKGKFTSFFLFNALIGLFCLPWLLFMLGNYRGQSVMDPLTVQDIGSLWDVLYASLSDWIPRAPLLVIAGLSLLSFPFVTRHKGNALVLLGTVFSPIIGLYLYCRLFGVTQFISSRYFVHFLPLFLITLYLSFEALESRWERLKGLLRPGLLFLILFVAANLVILPVYYGSERQDFRSLARYLNTHLREGDKVIVNTFTYIPGILHYFQIEPQKRHYVIPFAWKDPGKAFEFRVGLVSDKRSFAIYHTNIPYGEYVADGSRLWILTGKGTEEMAKKSCPSCVLKGYFDGTYAHFRTFPSDASMYLFLWDPKSPHEKGIDDPAR